MLAITTFPARDLVEAHDLIGWLLGRLGIRSTRAAARVRAHSPSFTARRRRAAREPRPSRAG